MYYWLVGKTDTITNGVLLVSETTSQMVHKPLQMLYYFSNTPFLIVYYWIVRLTITNGVLWVSETVTMEIMYYLLVIDTVTFADCVLLVSETYHISIWCCDFNCL